MDKIILKSKKGLFTAEQYDTAPTHFFLWKGSSLTGTIRYRVQSNEYSVELDDITGYTTNDWKELYPLLADLLYMIKRDKLILGDGSH